MQKLNHVTGFGMLFTAMLSWVAFAELDESLLDGASLLQTHGLIGNEDPDLKPKATEDYENEGGVVQKLGQRQSAFTSEACTWTEYARQYCSGISGDYTTGSDSVEDCKNRCSSTEGCRAITWYPSWSGRRCYLELGGCSRQSSSSGGVVYTSSCVGQVCADGSPTAQSCQYYQTQNGGSYCNMGKTGSVRRRQYGGDAKDNCYASCGYCQVTVAPTPAPTPTPTAAPTEGCTWTEYAGQYCSGISGDYTTGSGSVEDCKNRCSLTEGCRAITWYASWSGSGDARCYLELGECSRQSSSSGGVVYTSSCVGQALPTPLPTPLPTEPPTPSPTQFPTESPTPSPTLLPTESPTPLPTECPPLSTNGRCGPEYGGQYCSRVYDAQWRYCSIHSWCGDTSSHQNGQTQYDEANLPEGCNETAPPLQPQQPSAQDFTSTRLDFRGASLTENNLGGKGPVAGSQRSMLFRGVTPDGMTDLLVSNISEYLPFKAEINGFSAANASFAQIGLKCGASVALEFTFLDSMTAEPKFLSNFNLTIADLDRGTHGRCQESIEVPNHDGYTLAPNTTIQVSMDQNVSNTRFIATEAGEGVDNPESLEGMSQDQKGKAVNFMFTNTESFVVRFFTNTGVNRFSEDPDVVGYGGRRLLIGGTSP